MEFINPLDVPYKFQHYTRKGCYAHREAADPTLVFFKGRYYCFASMCGGFYWTDDLERWHWHENRELDMYLYAPDARAIGDWLYFCASNKETPSIIRRTRDPMTGPFEVVSMPFEFWDPDLFLDDDGRIYLYWGCNDKEPLYGIELDRETMLPIGERTPLIFSDDGMHGWERYNYPGLPAPENDGTDKKPFIEGTFMTKVNGIYYLQYACPGTEMATYGDGVYTGTSPLGPFTFHPNTPFSFRPSGFLCGAGHGSTIFDAQGRLWHMATGRVSVNRDFERRIVLVPAGVDSNGVLYCNQQFADYPYAVPDGCTDPSDLLPEYMLLSYRKKATVSGSLPGHGPELAMNEDIRTWWAADASAGAWYCLDLGDVYRVHSVQLNFAEHEVPQIDLSTVPTGPAATRSRFIDLSPNLYTRYILEGSTDGIQWETLEDASQREEDRSHPYFILPEDKLLQYLRVTAVELPYGEPFALSGFRVFGNPLTRSFPSAVEDFTSVCQDGGMTYALTWQPAPDVMGYSVCFGLAPDKLYHSYQLYNQASVLITAANAGVPCWCRIDSFNESGVTRGTVRKL